MAAGTATLNDSYYLSQSAVFKGRIQSGLLQTCENINSEAATGITGNMPNLVHSARKNLVSTILNPATFPNWLTQFTMLASVDNTVISAATQAANNYSSIFTSSQADIAAASSSAPLITDTMVLNAISAAFNSAVPGI